MNCKEFESQIPDFLDLKMNFQALKAFLEHRDGCPNCREELEIAFLVQKGIQHLEEGDAFDLQEELKRHLEEANRKVELHRSFLKLGVALQILAGIALSLGIIWILCF